MSTRDEATNATDAASPPLGLVEIFATEPDFWRFVVWGARLALSYGDLALHK